jgi:hypothetical protein
MKQYSTNPYVGDFEKTKEEKMLQAAYRRLRAVTYTKPIWQKSVTLGQCYDRGALTCQVTWSLHLECEAMIRMVKRHSGELILQAPLSHDLMTCSVEAMPHLIRQKAPKERVQASKRA